MDSPTETGLNDSSGWLQNSNSLGLDPSSPVTPESERLPLAFNGSSNSDSSYSELDSEAEAFYSSLNHHLVSPETMNSLEFAKKQMSYGELIKKFLQCEEELKITTLKLQESQQEIEKLKSESVTEIETRDSEIETERKQVLELQRQVVSLETKLSDSNFNIERLVSELEVKKDETDLFAELETVKRDLETRDIEIENERNRVLELQRQVVSLETKLSDSSFDIESLVNDLEVSKECLEASDAKISKLQTLYETQVKEIDVLKDQIKHSDEEKIELQAEINAQDKRIESLNKDFDKHKLRYDMLMAEKDEVCAEVNNLKADIRSRDIQIEQLNQLVTESRNVKKIVDELRLMVKELEKLVELQRIVISEGEEEKREAIRQLCFSLDHYKSGYRELVKVLKRQQEMKK